MNSKILICLVIGVLALAHATKTHQSNKQKHIYSSKKYQELLHSVLQENERAAPFLQNMKALIQIKGTGYQKIHDIDDHIGNLYQILVHDQEVDDVNYANDKKRIEDAIAFEYQQITDLRVRRQLLRDKLVALRNERAKIENIYQTDKVAYQERTTKQSELARVLDELIEQSKVGLLENPIVPGLEGTNVSEVLAQVKAVGRGRPIEALVQLTKIFTKGDAADIIQRFVNLQNAIYESLRIDTEKEDHNLQLYIVLTHNIDEVLIPQAENEINEINSQIKVHKANIVALEEELERITKIYNQRKEERNNALTYTSQASGELKNELERLNAMGAQVE